MLDELDMQQISHHWAASAGAISRGLEGMPLFWCVVDDGSLTTQQRRRYRLPVLLLKMVKRKKEVPSEETVLTGIIIAFSSSLKR